MPGQAVVTIGSKQWQCSVANTAAELTTGLSGVSSLPAQTGMLFDLGVSLSQVTINMTEMLMPLDVVFMDASGIVLGIFYGLQPGGMETFQSDMGIRYFLEMNAGEAADILPGDEAYIAITGGVSSNWIAPVITLAGVAMIGLMLANMGKSLAESMLKKPGDRVRLLPQTVSKRLKELEIEAEELQRKIRSKYPAGMPHPWPQELRQWHDRLWQLGHEIAREKERSRLSPATVEDEMWEKLKLQDDTRKDLYQPGRDGYPVGADKIMRHAWGPIPDPDQPFWSSRGYIKPSKIYGWQFSPDYNEWRAFVRFPHGEETWTSPLNRKKSVKDKPTRHDVAIGTWSERDRIGIWLTDKRTDKTLAEWWDEDANEMFEQGWFKPGDIRQQGITGRAFEQSVLDYAESVGIIAGGKNYLPQTVQSCYYWTGLNKDSGEIVESYTPYDSFLRALKSGRAWVSRNWRLGEKALIQVWTQPNRYSEKLQISPVASETVTLGKASDNWRPEVEGHYQCTRCTWEGKLSWTEFLDIIKGGGCPECGHTITQAGTRQAAVRVKEPRSPRSDKDVLEFLPDSPEFLAYTIEDIGYRDRIDSVFLEALARVKKKVK
ncbi:DUF192 domain-containing protein [Chloroflexota bacterium]